MSRPQPEQNFHEEARKTVLRLKAGEPVTALELTETYTCLMFSDHAVRDIDPENWSIEKTKQKIRDALKKTVVKVA